MKTNIRKYAAEQGIAEEEALKKGMEAKSKEFEKRERRFMRRRDSDIRKLGWQVLSAGHMGIHRVQIERIGEGMSPAP